MSRSAQALGVLVAGKAHVSLNVPRVERVALKDKELKYYPYCDFSGYTHGEPEMWDVRGGKLYVHPIPDKAYAVRISFASADSFDRIPIPTAWLTLYESELERAKATS